jgi:SAM-dependent methyltransferase
MNTTNAFTHLQALGWDVNEHARLNGGIWRTDSEPIETAFAEDYQIAVGEIEDRSIWFQWRNEVIENTLARHGHPSCLWDVGSGNGSVAKYLEDRGVEVVAVEPGAAGAEAAAARGVRNVILGTFEELRLPDRCLECVGLFDVIEHLAEPSALLRAIRVALYEQGSLVVSVPALPCLWSPADVIDGHFRRYTRKTLRTQLEDSGFRVDAMNYHFAAVVPHAFLTRVLPWRLGLIHDDGAERYNRQLGSESRALTAVASAARFSEALWARVFPVPFGTSLVAVATPA